MNTLRVKSSKYVMDSYPLYAPPSVAAGQDKPDNTDILPHLAESFHGTKAAVGHIPLHLVYRYNFDSRSGRGNWSFVYMERNGEQVAVF